MARKEIAYQGLADLAVSIEDTSALSPDYFRIVTLPTELSAGINTFSFKGNTDLFIEGTEIFIEVLDSNGEPIYYETGLDLESDEQTGIVTIYITDDIPPGTGQIIICSTVDRDVNNFPLNASSINLRWSTFIYIDPSKRNESEIIFNQLPEVTILASTGSYTNFVYAGGARFVTASLTNLLYYNYNNLPVLVTSSLAASGFNTGSIRGTLTVIESDITSTDPPFSGVISTQTYSSSFTVLNEGAAVLTDAIVLNVLNNYSYEYPTTATVVSASVEYELSASLSSSSTENTYNLATAYFNNLVPQTGTVSKIRSYYKSAGVGEYILSNETDIEDLSPEFGFTPSVVSASFAIPTVHRNDRFDFKFEFVNPNGYVSKQVLEAKNFLFLGGNTYIGGDDNLITGSLYVAGQTGTGVQISGRSSAAIVKSIGYEGFSKAINNTAPGGFVLYSGSVQPLLGATENYSGVGLEMVANTNSYFKYTTSGSGLLDIRTNRFFLGSTASFISASNGELTVFSENYTFNSNGFITASGIFVAKNVGGNIYTMIDTQQAILDATNIARTLYTDSTLREAWSTGSYSNPYIIPIGSFVFQGLRNETIYTISYQSKIYRSGSGAISNNQPYVKLAATLSYANSGSGTFDTWTTIPGSGNPCSQLHTNGGGATPGGSAALYTFSENLAPYINLDNASARQHIGKLFKMTINAYFNTDVAGSTLAASGAIKNITVTAGRPIGASWGRAVTSTQNYSTVEPPDFGDSGAPTE